MLDPAGVAVARSLRGLGYSASDVRIGKLIEVEIDADDMGAARAAVEEMAKSVLANPVLEDYTVEVRPL